MIFYGTAKEMTPYEIFMQLHFGIKFEKLEPCDFYMDNATPRITED